MQAKTTRDKLSFEFFDRDKQPTQSNYQQLIRFREAGQLPDDADQQIKDFRDKVARLPLTLEYMWYQDSANDQKTLVGYMMSKYTELLDEEWLTELLAARMSGVTAHELAEKIKARPQYDLGWDKVNRFSWEPDAFGKGVLSLVNIEVARTSGGQGLSDELVTRMLARAYDKFNISYAIAYSRIPQYDRSDLQQYVERQRESDQFHPDWGIRFHQRAGGVLICGVENCAENDPDSDNKGSLVIYDLVELRKQSRI